MFEYVGGHEFAFLASVSSDADGAFSSDPAKGKDAAPFNVAL